MPPNSLATQQSTRTAPRSALTRFAQLLGGLCLAVSAARCGADRGQVRAPPPDFTGTQYPAPHGLPPSAQQALPPPQASEVEMPEQPVANGELENLPEAVRNDAIRDQETIRLVHSYFSLADALYRVSSARQDGGRAVDEYDPIPLWRLHAQLVGELARLARRAAILQSRYMDMAQEQGIGLTGSIEGRDYASRMRYFYQLCTCVRRDVEDRTAHGMAYLRALQVGATDDDLRHKTPIAQRRAADMQMMGRTVECTRLAARALRGTAAP